MNGRRRHLVAVAAVVVGALAALTPTAGTQSKAPPVADVAQELVRSGARSAIVYTYSGGKEHVATAGTRRPRADERFRIGSVTKTFTAALVLQLVQEGKLSLESTLEELLPGVVPRGSEMTVRMLLGHRSGLANHTDYPYWPWLNAALDSPATQPIDILRFAASKPLVFEPGSQVGYSNTNYVALGVVIEKVTGSSYAAELERRILRPLALTRTELPTTRRLADIPEDEVAPGGLNWLHPLSAWAAGSMVSTARDLRRFYAALLSGQVVSRASLATMKQTVQLNGLAGAVGVGLGIFSVPLPCGVSWGHTGGIHDSWTDVSATADGKRISVVSMRSPDPLGVEPQLVSALLCLTRPELTGVARSRIAFARTGRQGGLFVARGDGSGQRRVATLGVAPAGGRPAWAPDGERIAFVAGRGRASELYVVRADGTKLRRLTRNAVPDREPSWSPDGRSLAFVSRRSGNDDVWAMNADGSGLRNLTRNAARDGSPVWSPRGGTLAFVSDREGADDVFVLRRDGGALRNLTRSPAADSAPAWSPDGRRIAFASRRGATWEVWVMNADGSGKQRVAGGHAPAWSPDGLSLAFEGRSGLRATMPGGWQQRLLARRGHAPLWSPDGETIAFLQDGDIYTVGASATGTPRNLTRSRASDGPFAWAPDADAQP